VHAALLKWRTSVLQSDCSWRLGKAAGWSAPYHRRTGRLRRVLMDVPYNRLGLPVDPRYAVAQDGGAVELVGQ